MESVYTNFGAIRIEHLGITPLTKSELFSMWTIDTYAMDTFDRVKKFIVTTFCYHPAYNVPTCLAKLRGLKPTQNKRYNEDSPAFKTKMDVFSPF